MRTYLDKLSAVFFGKGANMANYYNEKTANRIVATHKKGEKINVIFFVIHSSVWQFDDLYWRYEQDRNYHPVVVVIPYTMYGDKTMKEDLKNTYIYFKSRNYRVINSYDSDKGTFLDIKSELNPDIVFFTNPHKITKEEFYVDTYCKNSLTCYAPYGILSANLQDSQYNQPFHNHIWRNFCETDIHYKMACKYANNRGKNTIITGYPKCDVFLDGTHKIKSVWKKNKLNLKKIIWAPHHTIEDNKNELGYSNFLKFHQVMLDIAEKYKNKIQITFKPHPILFTKLTLHEDWGERKTRQYYKKWEKGKNTQLELNDYIDLFLSSDGMIMDSISFISEYLYVHKPTLFMEKDKTIKNKFNEFGSMAYSHLYKSNNYKDIVNFIEAVIINKKDRKKKSREQFFFKHMIPPNNQSATDNIFNYIQDYLHLR